MKKNLHSCRIVIGFTRWEFFPFVLTWPKNRRNHKVFKIFEERSCHPEKEGCFFKGTLGLIYGNPKDSRNSSTPPFKDENRPKANQSLCKSSGNRVVGQKGREGKTLEMTGTPDKIGEF